METNSVFFFFFFFFCCWLHQAQAQPPFSPNTTGYACPRTQTTYPCQTYVYYRARAPQFLDLASIGDLFEVSRLKIAEASNISSPSSALQPNQSLFIPINCGCNSINNTIGSISFANITYTILKGDTFLFLSTSHFQNLTTYQSVEVVNPTLVATNLDIGQKVVFPVFCKCPTTAQLQNQTNFLISYVVEPTDTLNSIASRFGTTARSIISDINGNNIQPFDTVFVPVPSLPVLQQPVPGPTASPPGPVVAPSEKTERKGVIIGLSIGLGVCGILLILVAGLWVCREGVKKKREEMDEGVDVEKSRKFSVGEKAAWKKVEANLMADVSDCLDKYRLYGIEELIEATDGFHQNCLIQGSVYKGCINGDFFAIKKMKWNAREELKILQKVNHGNLVRLEGFCIDPEEANCYLVYEYVENGALHSWLHDKDNANNREKLSWKTRLRIAIDVANGLQYIHEHTRPRVVHKDIKSSNILLDATMRAKIANFGLAKSGCNAITMHIVGTQGYIAPEYLSDGVVSTKMDVFSFGVVLLELISGREAMDESGKMIWADADQVLKEGIDDKQKAIRLREWMDESLVIGESCSIEGVMNVMAVAVACVVKDPSKRPSMVDIVYALCKSDDLFLEPSSEETLPPQQVSAR